MYAIVEIAGQQFKVAEGNELFVHHLDATEGDKLEFDNVLLTDNEGSVTVGTPTTGNKVSVSVVEHLQGDKVIVFKKKRRKGYTVKNGHRQQFTKIKIEGIA